ncbi:MAG: tripartite tricarboxylate transporter substrate binding protein [Planctomycetes bacterium]|nr:tripartite tricarboxylate transporter substrate binding protein [Planctomycetota bacterium]
MKYFSILTLLFAFGLLGCTEAASGSSEGEFPSSRITIHCPNAQGGASDTVCRTIQNALRENEGWDLSVTNGGGATELPTLSVKPADGYHLIYVPCELAILPYVPGAVAANLSHEKFDLLCLVNSVYSAVTVRADSPWKSLQELVDAGKTKTLQIGVSAQNGIWELAGKELARATGASFNYINHGSASDAVAALQGTAGIDAITVSASEVKTGVESGELRILAVMKPERESVFPDVPTVKEAIGQDVSVCAWGGFAVPKGTPEDVRKTLVEALKKAHGSETFQNMAEKQGILATFLGEAEFLEFVKTECEKHKRLLSR